MTLHIRNPIAFTPVPVTVICTVVYAALIIPLLVIHHTVPQPEDLAGTNLTEAWLDLQTLSNGFHPYNSRENDDVRSFLFRRIEAIVQEAQQDSSHDVSRESSPQVTVFSDTTSNASFSSGSTCVYFEGTNIIVYIRGSEDDPEDWWLSGKVPKGKGGVLLNAHYDSVSTGLGATDDGVGVVTILQLIKFFSSRQPRKGIVVLLNNGEEDFLNGARAFAQHPMSKFPHTFLNLEGAGAGGRAALFRTTDTEVTRFYQSSKHPFGTVLSGDAFKRGVVKSDTDYSVFNGFLGMRGLDIAFMEPRARYHTDEDDARHTSKASLYHMLSAALSTMQGLTADTSSAFNDKKSNGQQESTGVWFDLFGSVFAVFKLNALFALSVTLLAVAPVAVIAISVILYKVDKLYLFSYSSHSQSAEGDASVGLKGWRGVSRFPIALVLASAATVGLAFLLTTANPYIVYSSPYAVWAMMISAWIVITYVCSSTADFLRPTALQRAHVSLWMFLVGWVILVAVTKFERQSEIAGGYFMVFYFACISLGTITSLLELFGLPRRTTYAGEVQGHEDDTDVGDTEVRRSSRLLAPSGEEQSGDNDLDQGEEVGEDANETTSLLRGGGGRTTFKRYSSSNHRAEAVTEHDPPKTAKQGHVFGSEQPWSHSLPSSLWLLSFLFLAPIPLILIGQVSLFFTTATYQTLADGNPPLLNYLLTAILSILLFLPLSPFLHRYTPHIPAFLFLVFVGTLLYNTLAFPFSPANRLKIFFLQRIDLDTGATSTSLTGISTPPFLQDTIQPLPSAAAHTPLCAPSQLRKGLTECSWPGLPPRVVPSTHPVMQPNIAGSSHNHTAPPSYADWLTFNATRLSPNKNSARFHIPGRETRACKILFSAPISTYHVHGSNPQSPFQKISPEGGKELRLWSRTWDRGWDIDISWDGRDGEEEEEDRAREGKAAGLQGRVVCLWSDWNTPGLIPALDEVAKYAPEWVAVSKCADGLVEGSKAFAL